MAQKRISNLRQLRMTDFSLRVIELILEIPEGKVTTYGQIALWAGKPGGSRGVGWILHSSSKAHKLPWHRVMGSTGKISFPVGTSEFRKQRKLLVDEGVEVSSSGRVDLETYGWKRRVAKKKTRTSQPRMFSNRLDIL